LIAYLACLPVSLSLASPAFRMRRLRKRDLKRLKGRTFSFLVALILRKYQT
jgi:hypothetical protein